MAQKKYPTSKKIIKFLAINFEKPINKIYNKVIQVNPAQYKWLTKDYGFKKEKIFTIPNGIDKSIFKKANTPKQLKNKFIISYIGRLAEYKGIHDIIKVLPELIKIKQNLLLIIIGQDSGYYQELKRLVNKLKLEKYVKFMANINDKQKEEILETSEIFIMSSEWEAFGIAILEAMAKENAIISTNTEGGKFLITRQNGRLYDFGNLNQLKNILKELIANNKIRKEMQNNNKEKAKKFTWDKIAEKLEGMYKKL